METLAQLQSWQKQAIGNEKASANMDVALRLLRHGAEAIAEIERLRAELAQCQQEMQQIRQMGDTIPLPVCEAYGELWMTVTKNKRINRARHLLVSCMTMEERKAGIELVRERMRTSAALNGEEAK